jgi:hypothetical protein
MALRFRDIIAKSSRYMCCCVFALAEQAAARACKNTYQLSIAIGPGSARDAGADPFIFFFIFLFFCFFNILIF